MWADKLEADNIVVRRADLVSDDFTSYLEAHKMIDQAYVDQPAWIAKTVRAVARMGKFSSDRAVQQYCDEVWNVEPCPVKPRK